MGASSRVRDRSRDTGAVISAFVSSSFAKLRTAVLQREKEHCPWSAVAFGRRTQVRTVVSSLITRFSLRGG